MARSVTKETKLLPCTPPQSPAGLPNKPWVGLAFYFTLTARNNYVAALPRYMGGCGSVVQLCVRNWKKATMVVTPLRGLLNLFSASLFSEKWV